MISFADKVICKVWSLSSGAPTLEHTFECEQGAVLAVVVSGDIVYAGCQDGYVKVWDLETKTLVRRIIVSEVGFQCHPYEVMITLTASQNVDILSLSILHSDLYTCSANVEVQVSIIYDLQFYNAR